MSYPEVLRILDEHVAEFYGGASSDPRGMWRCSCGWRKDYAVTPFADQHRRHLARVLAVPSPQEEA